VSDKSTIEWLDGGSSWNPVRGCEPCAPECKNCYARTFAERWRGIAGHPYEQGFDPRTVPDALDLPLRWKKPRTIFVNSMSDLFHDDFREDYIAEVFGVMAVAGATEKDDPPGGAFHGPGDRVKRIGEYRMPIAEHGPHAFIVLTKRETRMMRLLSSRAFQRKVSAAAYRSAMDRRDAGYLGDCIDCNESPCAPGRSNRLWPLPNVTLGVSVGTVARRGAIDLLRQTPSARRMVSFEPLLDDLGDVDLRGIDLAAIGGESGPGARPCRVEWIRSLVKQCRAAGCKPFVKQLGARPMVGYYDQGFREMYEAGGYEWPDPEGWSECDGQPGLDAAVRLHFNDRKASDPAEWTPDLRVREMPEATR
jgi:protein gp37